MIHGKIVPSNSFTWDEQADLAEFAWSARKLNRPLSGYLAGRERGGDAVILLEDTWSKTFNVKHSIAVNSATSGLLAAAFASNLKEGDTFVCPAMTMSATAAAPCFTGAIPDFRDVSEIDFSIEWLTPVANRPKAIFVTNLFGNPAKLHAIRRSADLGGVIMIEDNAQSPFAMEKGRYAGTIGHIGVFSLNIHKPLQCGEGGMICTDNDVLALRMRAFINHGEHTTGQIGLNLRMPELCAVVALSQLQRGQSLVNKRIEQAEAILDAIGFIPGLRGPMTRSDCKNVHYTIPFLIDRARSAFCQQLALDGVPICEKYVAPLYHLPAFRPYTAHCPVAESLHERQLFYIENCAWDFTKSQIREIGAAFKRAAETVKL